MTILQVGAGNVGWAVAHKLAECHGELGDIVIASRTRSKSERIIASVRRRRDAATASARITAEELDATDVDTLARLVDATGPSLVVNVGPPWINVAVMEACVRAGASYLDTSVAVDLCSAGQTVPFAYDPQWAFRQRFEAAGLTGILGTGFDPGVVSAFATYAGRHLVDEIESIDVMDVNAGDHGRSFATNFDPETNLLEIQGDSFYWEDGCWRQVPCHSRRREFDFPVVGRHTVYSMAHDEVRSLVEFVPARRVEFWMGFTDRYLRYFNVLRDVGMLSPEPVAVGAGVTVSPLRVLKAVLPDPTSLAEEYTGQTCIGTLVAGTQGSVPRAVFLYNVCDHADAYREIGCQAISYTTGVPAVTAALLHHRGPWSGAGLFNVEQLDPDPFLSLLPELGLPWDVMEVPMTEVRP